MTQKLSASGGLIVRGEDQLYSIKAPLAQVTSETLTAAEEWVVGAACPANELWKVTNITLRDMTRATTGHIYGGIVAGIGVTLGSDIRDLPIESPSQWRGEIWLEEGDYIQGAMFGSQADDECYLYVVGHRMTLEV